MSTPYIGEIRLFGGNFAPVGWHFCDGAPMSISENDTLFNLIGTTYGGDGQTTFNLPDLQGRVPVHQGTGPGLPAFTLGEVAGTEEVTLTVNQIPVHTHQLLGSTDPATSSSVQNNVPASLSAAGTASAYGNDPPPHAIDPSSVAPVGGNQPHTNVAPVLCVSFIISLYGIYPPST